MCLQCLQCPASPHQLHGALPQPLHYHILFRLSFITHQAKHWPPRSTGLPARGICNSHYATPSRRRLRLLVITAMSSFIERTASSNKAQLAATAVVSGALVATAILGYQRLQHNDQHSQPRRSRQANSDAEPNSEGAGETRQV